MEGSDKITSGSEYLQVFELTPDNNRKSEWETWLENSRKGMNEKEIQALPMKQKIVKFSPCFVKLEKIRCINFQPCFVQIKRLRIKNFSKSANQNNFEPNQNLHPFIMNKKDYRTYLEKQLNIFKILVTSPMNGTTQEKCDLNLRDKTVFRILRKFVEAEVEKTNNSTQ